VIGKGRRKRGAQDEFARESTRRAIAAQQEGLFRAEIVPVEIEGRKGEKTSVADDEGPKLAKPEKIPSLKPLFKKDGTVTAANASSINDGAAKRGLASLCIGGGEAVAAIVERP
jgi:acetyl-CoA C-acetyltransferase